MTYDWSHSCLQRGGVWKIIEYTHHHRPTFEKIKALATLSPLRHPLLFEIA